jgi:hypothetical protein
MFKYVHNNKPEKSGQAASDKVIFGYCSRYAVQAIHTRFDKVMYFVFDAELPDEITGKPSVIRQSYNLNEALHNLE